MNDLLIFISIFIVLLAAGAFAATKYSCSDDN